MTRLSRRMATNLHAINEACRTVKDAELLWERIREPLLEGVPSDLGAFAVMDPVTGLIVDGYGFGDARMTHTYFSEFYLKRELCSYLDQWACGEVLFHLSRYTGGNLEQDPVYRDWLRYEGYRHATRTAFVAGGYYWGGFCAVRGQDVPDFNDAELVFLRSLVEPVGRALRTAAAWKQACAPAPPEPAPVDAGALFLDRHGRVPFRTRGAQAILDDIAGPDARDLNDRLHRIGGPLPVPVLSACARLRVALDRGEAVTSPVITLKGRSQWWTVTATLPEPGMSEEVESIVILARAQPRDTAAVLLAAYNLTRREEDIVHLVRLGLSTAQIAAKLFVSSYTVQDHLKSIFAKVGVRTRGELMAVIFREESPVGRNIARIEAGADGHGP